MFDRYRLREIFEHHMLFIGVFGQVGLCIQIIKILLSHSARDISVIAVIIGLITALSWLIYGILRQDKVLITSNILGLLCNIIFLTLTIRYKMPIYPGVHTGIQ